MEALEDKTIYELANRLNEITREIQTLELEHNKIIKEIKRRLPKLKDDKNLEEKVLRKVNI